jgi:NAD(P)-dependent dehydrogenase (short-subunit alcohol dehydrogenase family)
VWTIHDKTVLITGATSGIGLEAAVALATLGARPILVGRDRARTAAAVATVRTRAGVEAMSYLCDVSSQADIRRLADAVRSEHSQLHVLINNAGGVNKRRGLTADGIERTFATNHLGSFLLTNLLLDLLKRSAPARVITVSSISHRRGTMDFDDLGFERGYWIMRAYSRSKLANVLFANELARRLAGTGVTSNSLHPGRVATNIWTGAPLWTRPYIYFWLRPTFISSETGGQTIVHLAASRELEDVSGQYLEKNVAVTPAPPAQDVQLARRLWDVSAKLTNLRPAV